MKNEWIERYQKFCNAFDLEIGNIIKVNGWYSYIVCEDRFYIYDNNVKKYTKSQPFEQIINRNFIINK